MVSCFAPNCKSGYGGRKCRIFRAPKDVRQKWVKILGKLRADKKFDPSNRNHALCSLHFEDAAIVKTFNHNIKGTELHVDRERWTLKPGAVPTIFPNVPARLHPKLPKSRRVLIRKSCHLKTSEIYNQKGDNPMQITPPASPIPTTNSDNGEDTKLLFMDIAAEYNWTLHNDISLSCFLKLKMDGGVPRIDRYITFQSWEVVEITVGGCDVKEKLNRKFPNGFSIGSRQDVVDLLTSVAALRICGGIPGYADKVTSCISGTLQNGIWYSQSCEKIGSRKVCTPCVRFLRTIQNRFHAAKGSMITRRPKKNPETILLQRCRKRISVLSSKTKTLMKQMAAARKLLRKANYKSCIDFIQQQENLHQNTKEAIMHILQSIKVKSAKGNRYSSKWLLECLLLRIKSPAAYRHLREANILPLPCNTTLQKLIAHERCKFGFSTSSLNAIKRECDGKSRRDRQGTLIFDEVKLRESLDYNRQTHKIDGFVDYGEDNNNLLITDHEKFANHALVMMYRPMNANWVQPIAAFATRDAAKGDHLAKLVIQAIINLEYVGAEVLNVVCDGAKPNKKMWKCFGIDGLAVEIKNKISHPCDENRLLFFSSDVPHLFKCIRNHFMNRGQIQGKTGKFCDYEKLYNFETTLAPGLRVCPKLTSSHIRPNNFEKMVVPYATQLFSRHVGKGLQFYMNNPSTTEEFYDVEGTSILTLVLNDGFDPLNAKIPSQGLRLGSNNFLQLKNFHRIINEELDFRRADKAYVAFATDETLAGLRVTVQSTLEIVEFLIVELGFSYVLTVKFNQDALEKFFGLIRAAGGREEHPTIKNFLSLYRLLSMYNPCKRVSRGNVREENDDTVLCRFRANLRKSAREIEKEQRALDEGIRTQISEKIMDCQRKKGKWSDALNDHNYCIPLSPWVPFCNLAESGDVDKMIIFQLSGYVAYKFRKIFKCEECYKSLYVSNPCDIDQDYRSLVDMYNQGPLHYPSSALFQFIVHALEPSITNIINRTSFFGDMLIECIKDMPPCDVDALGCSREGHQADLIAAIVPFYVNMRYDFWCRSVKDKVGRAKLTHAKRKESKLQ